MRFLKSRLLTSIIVLLMSLVCIAVSVLALTVAQETVDFRTPYMFIEGEYSVDGVGFDTSEVKNDGRSHVGMENTKRRLKDMCNAEVVITSTIGDGMTAKIIIPKIRRKRNEDTLC